jgi:hypothetical protein
MAFFSFPSTIISLENYIPWVFSHQSFLVLRNSQCIMFADLTKVLAASMSGQQVPPKRRLLGFILQKTAACIITTM